MSSSELPTEHLRRELRETDQLQREVAPDFRRALRRMFLSNESTVEQQRHAAIGGLSRRSVFKIGGVTLLGGAILAACGGDSDDPASTSPATSPSTVATAGTTAATTAGSAMATSIDISILRTASSIEELAVAVYQTAIDSGLVTTAAIGDAAMLFQAHHKEHSALFQSLTKEAGGEPFTMANPAILDAIGPAIAALKDEAGILALAFELETVAAQTYQSNVSMFEDLALNAAIMSVGGVEARHAAVLAGVLGQPQVPLVFQITEKATKAGTGV